MLLNANWEIQIYQLETLCVLYSQNNCNGGLPQKIAKEVKSGFFLGNTRYKTEYISQEHSLTHGPVTVWIATNHLLTKNLATMWTKHSGLDMLISH